MKQLFLTVIGIGLLLSSCRKDHMEFIPDRGQQLDSGWVLSINDENKIAELVKSITPPLPSSETVDIAANDTTIIQEDDYDILIPPGALKGTLTSEVTGKINYNFVLLQRKGDFIRFQQPTINTDKNLLTCGGSFYLRFFRGTEEITVAPGKLILVRYNESYPSYSMNVFYGGDNYSLSYPVNNAPGWMPANTSAYVKPVQRTYNNHTYYGYEVATDKTKWVNAANTLTPGPPLINMSVFLPDLFSNANTQIFLVLKDSRSISKLSGDPGSRKFIAANIPAGKAATLVCFAKCANNYFLAAKDISTGDGMTELKPMPSDLSKIISYLNSL